MFCTPNYYVTYLGYPIDLPIKFAMMYRFWYWRCQNDYSDMPQMLESFESGTTISLIAKKGIKKSHHDTF